MSQTAIHTKSPITGPRDYGYPNARLRGMRSHLIKAEALERLMETNDLHDLIQELMQTEYAPDLEEALIKGRGAAEIAEGLRLNLVRTYRKVFGFLNEEAKDVCGTLLGRWDIFNIKTIVRGRHVHLSAGEIAESLLPVGELSQVDLDVLLAQNDIRGVVDTATTWDLPQAPALREGFVEFQKSGELADLELALDRYFARWAAQRLAGKNRNYAMGRRLLGMQIDILNLIMLFRSARENLSNEQAERYFLLGGHGLELEMYIRLSALSDIDEVLDGLRATHYGKVLEDVAPLYLETMSIATFERALEDYLTRKMIAVGATDPLGVGIPIAYLWSKQNEVTNVRIITKAKDIGIPADRTRRELILV
ncbi:MAG TPA: V-type ATPase subunit [Coriobacteriia bacterium]|nr:V-type ATPase subunit [Coriobacteriia bacterium]